MKNVIANLVDYIIINLIVLIAVVFWKAIVVRDFNR